MILSLLKGGLFGLRRGFDKLSPNGYSVPVFGKLNKTPTRRASRTR